MSEQAPPGLPDPESLGQFRYWKPEYQDRALSIVREHEQSSWKPFFCTDRKCDGHPHDDWTHEHARADQWPPPWSARWLTLLFSGGRGSGKTRAGAEITNKVTAMVPRIILIAATGPDLRETMIEGVSGIMATAKPDARPHWEPSKRKLTWPNGCVGQGFSAEEPDRLRGPECLVAGTLVETEHGPRPIETIAVGDRVWTRGGLRPVMATGSRSKPVMTLAYDGGSLTGSLDHPVWTENRGWVHLQFISPDDTLVTWNPTSRTGVSSSTLRGATRSTTPAGSGSRSTAPSLTDGTSITSTSTASTTGSRTSPRSPRPSTRRSMPRSPSRTPVRTVAATSPSREVDLAVAALSASARPTESQAVEPTLAESSRYSPPASGAAPSSTLVAERCAARPASTATEQVFDLTVAEHHEFFANGILVHNSGYVWADEPGHWDLVDDVWDNMMFGLRMGKSPKIIATSTPKPTKWMKKTVKDPSTIVRRVSTYENIHNLSPVFRDTILSRYEGTRIGRQELHGELLEDVEGAMWNWEMIHYIDEAPELVRIVVAVDPAGTANAKSDETGIIILGIDADNDIYVLEDCTGRYSPERWASKTLQAYNDWRADAIVVERTYGQDMVRHTLESVEGGRLANIITVDSRRGKQLRAEPIVALYERGRVWHVGQRGTLADLEDEQTSWIPGQGASPNRVDALVHGATELAKRTMPLAVADPNKVLRNFNRDWRDSPQSRGPR